MGRHVVAGCRLDQASRVNRSRSAAGIERVRRVNTSGSPSSKDRVQGAGGPGCLAQGRDPNLRTLRAQSSVVN